MEKQIYLICKFCYYLIRNIGLIRKNINDETRKTFIQGLIISRLNCGIALLYNTPLSLTNQIHRVQKSNARLVIHFRKRELITLVLFQPLISCMFQITFQNPDSHIRRTLSDLINKYIPVTVLRSDSLTVPTKLDSNIVR